MAKVLFVSNYLKNVILIGAYPMTTDSLEMPKELTQTYLKPLIYTGKQLITDGSWPRVGNLPITEKEENWSLRVDCGKVWLKDVCLREATADEIETLPYLSVWGCALVESYLKNELLEDKKTNSF